MVMYITVLMPVNVSFDVERLNEQPFPTLDLVIDIAFILDVFLNFISAYTTADGAVVYHVKDIAKKYLKGWFWLDLIASVPFNYLEPDTGNYNRLGRCVRPAARACPRARLTPCRRCRLARLSRVARGLRMLRLLKLLRVSRLRKILTLIEVKMGIRAGACARAPRRTPRRSPPPPCQAHPSFCALCSGSCSSRTWSAACGT